MILQKEGWAIPLFFDHTTLMPAQWERPDFRKAFLTFRRMFLGRVDNSRMGGLTNPLLPTFRPVAVAYNILPSGNVVTNWMPFMECPLGDLFGYFTTTHFKSFPACD